jgi:hypothetical protein
MRGGGGESSCEPAGWAHLLPNSAGASVPRADPSTEFSMIHRSEAAAPPAAAAAPRRATAPGAAARRGARHRPALPAQQTLSLTADSAPLQPLQTQQQRSHQPVDRTAGRGRAPRPLAMLVLLAILALAAAPLAPRAAAAAARPALVQVSDPAQLLAAISQGDADLIHVMRPMVLPHGWGPARAARPLLVTSPHRALIDWCDPACMVSRIKGCALLKAVMSVRQLTGHSQPWLNVDNTRNLRQAPRLPATPSTQATTQQNT